MMGGRNTQRKFTIIHTYTQQQKMQIYNFTWPLKFKHTEMDKKKKRISERIQNYYKKTVRDANINFNTKIDT